MGYRSKILNLGAQGSQIIVHVSFWLTDGETIVDEVGESKWFSIDVSSDQIRDWIDNRKKELKAAYNLKNSLEAAAQDKAQELSSLIGEEI